MSRRWAAFVAVACLVLSGCSAISSAANRDESRPLVVVLLDVSRSTRDPEIRARYLEAVQQVLDDVAAEHGTVIGDVIDDNPLAHSSFPIDATFEGCDAFTDNRLECDARDVQLRRGVLDQTQAILARTPAAAGTDIYDGLRLAERVFASYPEVTVRRLVICSDMVQHAAGEPAVADLGGVSVYVVGAGVVSGATLPAERILAMQDAWQAYFARAGADLPPERYGATLVRFP